MESEKLIKIAFMGGPGVGKTTILDHFRNRTDSTVVDEAARDYFKLNPGVDRRAFLTQKLLLEHIIAREEAAIAFGKPITVCDRAVVDPIVYMHHYRLPEEEIKELFSGISSHIPTYNKLYLLDPHGVPYVQDAVRTESPLERMEIHEAFLYVLERENIEYELLSGLPEQRIMTVNSDIQLLKAA